MSITKRDIWAFLVTGLFEIAVGIGLICLEIMFYGFIQHDQTSTIKAVSVYIFLGMLIMGCFSFGIYHLSSFLEKKFGYQSSVWKITGAIALGFLFLVFGLANMYSAVMDIVHFFNCVEYTNYSYLKSAGLSIAPFSGLLVGLSLLFATGLIIKEKGRF